MSDQNSYLVTALVSTYNSSSLLRGCLEDLLNQSLYKKNQLEIIVIDSGSLENEGAIVAAYQQIHKHIRYFRTERETVYGAWNRGIQIAQGAYITNANTDDSHRNDALELLATALSRNPAADLVYAYNVFTRQANDTFPPKHSYLECKLPPFTPALGMFYCLLGPHPLWRKSVFSKIGMFNSSYVGAGDYDFQMRFIQAGLQAVLVPEFLSAFYQNPVGLSLSSGRTIAESTRLESEYRVAIPISRLYSIVPDNSESTAEAWLAQGNLAITWECAWAKNPGKDYQYAFHCYNKALEVTPNNYPAVRNLISSLAAEGKWGACEYVLAKHPLFSDLQKSVTTRTVLPLVASNSYPLVCSINYSTVNSLNNSNQKQQGQRLASRYLHASPWRDLLGTQIQYLREIQNALLDNRQEIGRDMLLRVESSLGEDSGLLAAAGVLSILAGLNQFAVHLLERSSEYQAGNPQTVMYALVASLQANHTPVIQDTLNMHLQRFPYLYGELEIDRLLNFITLALHDVEYVALGMPPQQIKLMQMGAQAASEKRWDVTITEYKQALEASDASELFKKPLQTKISFLENTLKQEIPESILSTTIIPAQLSRLCTEAEFAEPDYKKLCCELQIAPNHYHRKCWEYYFVAKGLKAAGLLREGTRGICFGAGREVLISYFARHGCKVTATDLEPDEMTKANWMDTNQHADSLTDLLYPKICPPDHFYSHVDFQYADMNNISDAFLHEQFDFSWSCCAFEHLGSIEQGKQFILNQMRCLKPGGVALHTTEFNIMSDVLTIDHTPTVLFRKRDIEEIARQLRNDGHTIEIDYNAGTGSIDGYVDIPPYMQNTDSYHLRLLLNKYVITSIGLYITKRS